MKIEHGANLYEISESLGVEKRELLDFSSNINPYGASRKAKEYVIKNIDMVSIYPDPEYRELKKSISQYCGVDQSNIILGSGATELISSFINIVLPKKALLISPAYSEYERELKKIECEVVKYFYKRENEFKIEVEDLLETLASEKPELLIICNPNNPTGSAFKKVEIEKLMKEYNGIVMIDETYIEFTEIESYSAVSLAEKYSNIFIIRGTSKFFSTPGIRLGYGILGKGKIFQRMIALSNLWNINIFAALMGEVMFKDRDYIEESSKKIGDALKKLKTGLESIKDIKIYDTTSNFLLCEILSDKISAELLREKLLKDGIIIRDASGFPGLSERFFRVCVLKEEDNMKLVESLRAIFF